MASIDQTRAAAEGDIARVLRRMHGEHRQRVLEAIRKYGSVQAIPESFWEELKSDVDSEVAAVVLLLMTTGYQSMQRRIARVPGVPKKDGASMDTEDAIRAGAARRAAELGREAAEAHVDYTRRRLDTVVQDANGDQARLEQGVKDVMRERPKPGERDSAETTAITTSTRGLSTGESSAVRDEAERRGVAIDLKWQTERDGKVCPVCRPLHGKPSIEWVDQFPVGPPAHPNCRCGLKPVYDKSTQTPYSLIPGETS